MKIIFETKETQITNIIKKEVKKVKDDLYKKIGWTQEKTFENINRTSTNSNNINENSNGIFDIADLADENSGSIFDLADLLAELDERVTALEEK